MRLFHFVCCLLVALLAGVSLGAEPAKVEFKKTQLDPKFRSEGVAAGDFNNDGKLDIAAGFVWYEAPSWKVHAIVDPGVEPEGQPVAGAVHRIDHGVEGVRAEGRDVEDRAEDFACQLADAPDPDDGGGSEVALAREGQRFHETAFGAGAGEMGLDPLARIGVDYRTDIGR